MAAQTLSIIASTLAIFIWMGVAFFLMRIFRKMADSNLKLSSETQNLVNTERTIRTIEMHQADKLAITRQGDGCYILTVSRTYEDLTLDDLHHIIPDAYLSEIDIDGCTQSSTVETKPVETVYAGEDDAD